jgi:hypothetical protein
MDSHSCRKVRIDLSLVGIWRQALSICDPGMSYPCAGSVRPYQHIGGSYSCLNVSDGTSGPWLRSAYVVCHRVQRAKSKTAGVVLSNMIRLLTSRRTRQHNRP